MAGESRHAAWQKERSFAVKLLPEQGPPADLASGIPEFLDAVDFAFDWLNREDPSRKGTPSLAIFETGGGDIEAVWSYPPVPPEGPALVELFGFNPVTWKSGVQEYSAVEPRRPSPAFAASASAVAVPLLSAPSVAAAAVSVADEEDEDDELAPVSEAVHDVPVVEHAEPARVVPAREWIGVPQEVLAVDDAEPVVEPTLAARVAFARRWVGATSRTAWADRVARGCLFVAVAALWLSLGLADPVFLALLLVALPTLWWRLQRGGAELADADSEDWL
ncbi:MAG TPA: hypothetical protein VEH79_04415 [Gaiellaceae bacterium]|nr:hypothetical protein [Gaiellaceae bacterium]